MLRSSLRRLTNHIPSGQIGSYLVIGLWNAAFGYGTFAFLTWLLDRYMPASYMAAAVLSSILSITVAFLGYKWFVFKTKGNYLKEWVRCLLVYGGGIVLSLVLLPPTVLLMRVFTGNSRTAPYLAGALILGVQVVTSFIGHKTFSFRRAIVEDIDVDNS